MRKERKDQKVPKDKEDAKGTRSTNERSVGEEIRELLRGVFLFENWEEEPLAALARFGRLTDAAKGDILFLQDDPCAGLFVLLNGKVQMFRAMPDGREITIHVLSPVDLVACAALFLDASYPASARIASRTARLIRLEGKPFLRMLETRPDLARKMIAALAMRISHLAASVESRTVQPALQRVAAWLLEQPTSKDGSGRRVVKIEGNKKSVAASLGITPETFSRSLRKLTEDHLVSVRGHMIVLTNTDGLLDVSGPAD
jgi:CRP/FNR family transcriptional regulator, dissimilatory nitrate respiration regulator